MTLKWRFHRMKFIHHLPVVAGLSSGDGRETFCVEINDHQFENRHHIDHNETADGHPEEKNS